jgi:hypothetical protein
VLRLQWVVPDERARFQPSPICRCKREICQLERTTTTNNKQTAKALRLGLHLMPLICLLVAAIALATVLGGLWPFDTRFSALVTGAGLAMLAIANWAAALAIVLISTVRPRALWRLAFWPLAVSLMMAVIGGAMSEENSLRRAAGEISVVR